MLENSQLFVKLASKANTGYKIKGNEKSEPFDDYNTWHFSEIFVAPNLQSLPNKNGKFTEAVK